MQYAPTNNRTFFNYEKNNNKQHSAKSPKTLFLFLSLVGKVPKGKGAWGI